MSGPDDRGLSLVELTSRDGEQIKPDLSAEVARVRAQLAHPKGARDFHDDGTWSWVKAPRLTARNLRTILREDFRFRDALKYNQHADVFEIDGEPLTDQAVVRMKMQIADSYDLEPAAPKLQEMVEHCSRPYHPIRDYLEGLRWDGRERLAGLLHGYAGAQDTEINRLISQRFAVSCVARVMAPGAKVDTVLILAGRQGLGKSTFFRALCGAEWFRDTALDIRNKDAFLALRGAWLYEMAELASMRARDAETVKAFLSATVDHYRKPYARNMVAQPRQCGFVGSTNEPSFLSDPTGARRFWPVRVERAPDVARVAQDRDQLWAEAVVQYQAGIHWWLETEEAELLGDSHERYQHEDPWEVAIRDWLTGGADQFTVTEVLTEAVRMDLDKQAKHHEMRVGGILARLGWEKRRVRVGGARAYRWSRPPVLASDTEEA